ncbi:MAG: SDR family oxidoreductase [Kiritimatiellae bacterium]|nr:SDR family oxidoreductase [Kiritimatiellia bacterium]
MNVLITGATGLLGREVFRAFQKNEWNLTGTSFRRKSPGLVRVDLSQPDTIHDFLNAHLPAVIVHTAAERHPDVSLRDPAGTRRLNVEATAAIASWAATHGAFVLYLSTDYVFDGTKPPYRPSDKPNPLNDYGRSKLDGEQELLSRAQKSSVILRVPILYGPCETLAESAVTVLADQMNRLTEPTLAIEDWATRYPTYTPDVAYTILQLVEYHLAHPDFHGIVHWSGNEGMTKYGMARVLAGQMGFPVERLVPNPAPPSGATRPKDAHLDCSALEELGIGRRTPFAEAIQAILHPA